MEEIVEIPSAETQDGQKSHSARLERGGILNVIGKISGKFRVAIAAFGLLVGGEIGCAHKPIVVPPSRMQPERQICVVAGYAEAGFPRFSKPYIIDGLLDYLRKRYTNVIIKDLGKSSGNSEYITNKCDDVLHLQFEAEGLYLHTQVFIANMQTQTETIEATLRIDADMFEDVLLKDYHPELLPPLSPEKYRTHLEQLESNYLERIKTLFAQFEKMDSLLSESTAQNVIQDLREVGNEYLTKFGESPRANSVKDILRDIDERIAHSKEEKARKIEIKRLAQERISEGKEVHKFRDLLAQGKTAEERGAYEEALGFFMQARNAAFAVVNLYREAEMPIPHEIDSLGNELDRGVRENEGRIGVIHPRPQGIPLSSSEAIMESFRMLGDTAKAVVVSPEFGAMLVKLVEVSDQIHQDLAREGFTAHLELRIVKPEFLSDKPIQNVDVTVTKKNPPYTSHTFRTTKEGIIEQGGRASFYLRPGQYEITSPIFKDRYTVNITEGQNSLTIELR